MSRMIITLSAVVYGLALLPGCSSSEAGAETGLGSQETDSAVTNITAKSNVNASNDGRQRTFVVPEDENLPKRNVVAPVKDGALHGEVKGYDDDGRLISINTFRNGKPDGKITLFYPSGNVMSVGFEGPEGMHGLHSNYFDGGGVASEAPYVDGQPHGWTTWYHHNGERFSAGRNERGERAGWWTYYLPDGRAWHVEHCSNGEIVDGHRLLEPTEQEWQAIQERDAMPPRAKDFWQ